MVELSPTLIFFAILFSVPLQFYFSPRSSSDAKYYLYNYNYKRKDSIAGNGENYGVKVQTVDDIIDKETLNEEKGIESRNDLFGGSDEPRDPRSPYIKYRVGQVVVHRIHNYRGVIVAWDEKARAPEWWLKKVHKGNKEWADEPNYTILIDTRDRLIPQIAYVVQQNVVISSGPVVHPLVKHYFESFDGTCYKSRPWHKSVYPND